MGVTCLEPSEIVREGWWHVNWMGGILTSKPLEINGNYLAQLVILGELASKNRDFVRFQLQKDVEKMVSFGK
jgi:hypothetical protein